MRAAGSYNTHARHPINLTLWAIAGHFIIERTEKVEVREAVEEQSLV